MNARNIFAMLLSCKEKANTRKLYVSSNLYCHGWTRGGTPGESGGGVGGVQEPGGEGRKGGSHRIKG